MQKFRPVLISDKALVNSLMRAGKGYWGYSEEGLDRFMTTFGIQDDSYFDHAFGFIGEENEQVIGYYLFTTDENEPELDCFFLDTKYIGKGYGRKLWAHCIEQAKAKGWTRFSFWSDPHSEAFYKHMGANTFEYRPMVTQPGLMAPIMRFVVL